MGKECCKCDCPKRDVPGADGINETHPPSHTLTTIKGWKWFHLGWTDFPEDKEHLDPKPKNLDLMLEYARKLSSDFKFVRVDFYVVNDELFLGELTFTPDGGVFNYKDKETEIYWGNQIKL